MNGRNNYLVVGIFVTSGIVLLVALSLMFAGGSSTEPSQRYTVFFHRDISGLTLGAPVRYLGVGVGQVIDMRLMTNNGSSVRVDLKVLQSTPINSATYASLAFQGVTGVAFISLAADDVEQPMALDAGDFEYPIIPARDVGLAALLSDGPEITHKITLLLDRANRILGEENQAAITRSLANIENLSESLADGPEITQKITLLLDRANRILDDKNQAAISRSLANIENLSGSLAAQENTIAALPEQLHKILEQIEKTIGQLQTTLDQVEPDLLATMVMINKTSTNLANISARMDGWVAGHDRDVDQFISGGLAQVPALITDTKNTIRELEKLLAELRNNPSQLVYKPQTEPVVVEP